MESLQIFTSTHSLSNLIYTNLREKNGMKMRWWMLDVWKWEEKSPFYSESPGSRRATRLNGIKTARKSKSREKTESLMGKRSTMDRGFHDGPTVVSATSVFFCSSFFPQAWQLKGMCGESKYIHLWAKMRAKMSKIYKTQKRTVLERKTEKGA